MPPARSHVSPASLSKAAPVFTALGDQTRLHIVSRLCQEGPLSIARLTEGTELSRQAVTKHLRTLSDAGLATCDRSGREQHWRIEARRLGEVRRLLGQISAQWDEALSRLTTLVERKDT
jgi:DNA-binding transcriptional ArsR family regulator